jgi:hypothetical protein
MKEMHLKPASFSRAQTVDQIRENMIAWPMQDTNNPMAYKHSIEFVEVENPNGSVGTLFEYYIHDNADNFVIHVDNVELKIERQRNTFVIIE